MAGCRHLRHKPCLPAAGHIKRCTASEHMDHQKVRQGCLNTKHMLSPASQVNVPGADLGEILPAARLLSRATALTPTDYERAKGLFLAGVDRAGLAAEVLADCHMLRYALLLVLWSFFGVEIQWSCRGVALLAGTQVNCSHETFHLCRAFDVFGAKVICATRSLVLIHDRVVTRPILSNQGT